ncbi:MAG TPA: TolC family protein [Myxococcota bacterium]
MKRVWRVGLVAAALVAPAAVAQQGGASIGSGASSGGLTNSSTSSFSSGQSQAGGTSTTNSSTGSTTTATSTSTTTGVTSSGGAVDASGLLGLKEPAGGVQTLSLDDAVRFAVESAPDSRIATERVTQQGAQLRRAWALLLPSLSVSGAYAHTCTGGGNGVDCGDRTTSLVDKDTIDQQALLFDSLADIVGIAADNASTPEAAADFRNQQVQLQAAAENFRNTDTTPVVVQPASQLSGQLTFTLPLLNPRAYPALLNAYDGVDASRLAREQAIQTLVFAVVRTYHAAVTAQRLRDASQRQVELTTIQRDAVKARVDAATQPMLALKRAELELLRAKQSLAQTTSAADNAIGVLGALIGKTERFALSPPAPVDAVAIKDVEAFVEQALTARPEVRTQRTVLTITERSQVDAWMQFLPSVALSASARATSFTQGFVRDPVTGILTISASLPLYDGGIRYAALDESTSRITEERVRLRQIEDRVAAQVRGNHREVLIRQDSLALAQQSLEVAREAQSQAQALFDAGVGTALDVSETNFVLFSAELEALRAELDLAQARLGLRWALGEPLAP